MSINSIIYFTVSLALVWLLLVLILFVWLILFKMFVILKYKNKQNFNFILKYFMFSKSNYTEK